MIKIKALMCGKEKPITSHPLGLAYLKTNVSNAQFDIVNNISDLSDCDFIGLSSTASAISHAIDVATRSSIPTILGGQGTLWDKISNYPFTHIVCGEGEKALSSILNGSNKRIYTYDMVDDIDTIKFPDLGVVYDWIPIITSRGCPFKCRFCSSQKYWGKVRWHSPEYVYSYLCYMSNKYPHAKGFYILDDLFAISERRVNDMKEVWIRANIHKNFITKGFVRSSTFNIEIANALKDMNFEKVRFGAESASNRVLKILGKDATVEDHQNTIDISNKVGLMVTASFIHSIPGETSEDIKHTKDFIERNKYKFGVEGYYKFVAFPGTDMYNGESPIETNMVVR